MMNQELGSQALTADVFDSVFDMWWPKLEEKVRKIMANVQRPGKQSVRSERDILEEILARVRIAPSTSPRSIHPGALEDLVETYERLMVEVSHLDPDARGDLLEILEHLKRPVDHIVRRVGFDENTPSVRRERIARLRQRANPDETRRQLFEVEEEEEREKDEKKGDTVKK
jgi:hypothetical protein